VSLSADPTPDWLENSHPEWSRLPLKRLFRIQKRIAGTLGYDVLSVTQRGVKLKDTTSGGGQLSLDYSKYQLVEQGDFVMNHMDLLTGFIDISAHHGVTSPDYRVFVPKYPDRHHKRFYLYVFQLCYLARIFYPLGQGSSQFGRWRLPRQEFESFIVPVPSLPTQKAISEFLDRKTTAIDALISKKQQLLELLAEKRAALINQAVTKGLDPNVPMKDSGIPWIGKIPAHWVVGQLRRWLTLQRGVDITKAEQREGDVPVVSSGGVSSYHDTPYSRGPGVVVGRKGSAGTVHFVETDYWPHDTTLWVKDFKGGLPRFVFYKLQNMRLETYDTGSANPTVNRNLVHPVPVDWPPVDEQRAIVAHLDSVGEAQAGFESALRRGVERLQEYRQALITAAVTGQLDITGDATR
jgi:type I restriction enzyme, S subunit